MNFEKIVTKQGLRDITNKNTFYLSCHKVYIEHIPILQGHLFVL